MTAPRMFVWSIDETAGFDTAWATIDGSRLEADGRAAGLLPRPYWIEYRLETQTIACVGECRYEYPVVDGIAHMLVDEARKP